MTWYAKGFPNAAVLRGKLCVIETLQEGLDLLDRAMAEAETREDS